MAEKREASAPIGIFDSGPGGLAVLREACRLLPFEDVVYLADTARSPYGPRDTETVRRFTVEIARWLDGQGVKIMIIACNTASAAGQAAARQASPHLSILGMIEPAVDAALRVSSGRRLGIWGTEVTIRSRAYDNLILKSQPDAKILGWACTELLSYPEKGQIENKPLLRRLVQEAYQPISDFGADTLILGCTDLTCLRDIIDEIVDPQVRVVDPAEQVVQQVRQVLVEHGLLRPATNQAPAYRFCITGNRPADFADFAARFMRLPRVDVTRVDLSHIG